MDIKKQDALLQIEALIRTNQLSRKELLSVLPHEADDERTDNSGSLLQRVMIYVGGVFIFAGISTYVGIVWDDIAPPARIVLSLGSGFVAFLLGLMTLGDRRFIKASTPLFLIAAFLEPIGLFVFLDTYLPSSNDIAKAALVVFGFMSIQQILAFSARQRTSLLFFSLFFYYLFLIALCDKLGIRPPLGPMILGLSGMAVAWGLNKSTHHGIAPFYFLFSSVASSAAFFDYLHNKPYDVLLIGVAASYMALSVFAKSRTLLVVSVISLLGYLGYFTDEYFKDLDSWPIALILMGLMMIGISVYAVKLGKKMLPPKEI